MNLLALLSYEKQSVVPAMILLISSSTQNCFAILAAARSIAWFPFQLDKTPFQTLISWHSEASLLLDQGVLNLFRIRNVQKLGES
jgi:hypothetical protein